MTIIHLQHMLALVQGVLAPNDRLLAAKQLFKGQIQGSGEQAQRSSIASVHAGNC